MTPSEIEEDALKKTIHQLRIGKGLTQTEMAEIVGVPQSTISKIESGNRRLDILELRNVCLSLEISLTQFINQLNKNIDEGQREI